MCGGAVYNAKTLIEIYEDVIDDISKNHDKLLAQELHYRGLGSVDLNITYHFNKEVINTNQHLAGQVCEGNVHLPVIHQLKQYY